MRTFKIELRVDFLENEETKYEVLKEAAKVAAKHLYTTALMISDQIQPDIVLMSDDFFAGKDKISLADDMQPTE
jgi:hypothetical protein